MPYISKEAKRLSQLKFKEKPPQEIRENKQKKSKFDYLYCLERDDIMMILERPDFYQMTPSDDGIAIEYRSVETDEEREKRIKEQKAEWDAYEKRKKLFYADIQKKIEKAEDFEKLRRNRFSDPDYIEMLRLKKKFGEQ